MLHQLPRRQTLHAAGLGLSAVKLNVQSFIASADPIRFAGHRVCGAADLYAGRHVLAKQITNNPIYSRHATITNSLTARTSPAGLAAVPDHGRVQCRQRYLLREAHGTYAAAGL